MICCQFLLGYKTQRMWKSHLSKTYTYIMHDHIINGRVAILKTIVKKQSLEWHLNSM